MSPGSSKASKGCADASDGFWARLGSKQLIEELDVPGGMESRETSDGGYRISRLVPQIWQSTLAITS